MMDSTRLPRSQMKMVKNTRPCVTRACVSTDAIYRCVGNSEATPVIDLSLASLKSLKNQYKDIQCFNQLIKADNKIDLFEWIMIQVISKHLKPHFESVKPRSERNKKLGRCESNKTHISYFQCSNDAGAAALASGRLPKVEGFEVGCYAKRKTNLKQLADA